MIEPCAFIERSHQDIPLILSVPHGGALLIESIPRRKTGILGIDKNTVDLTRQLIDKLGIFNKRPSYVISNIHRSIIDLNRSEEGAFAQDSNLARNIYRVYHTTLKHFIDSNLKRFTRSLLVDIHGFEKYKRPPGYREVEVALGTDNLKSLFPNPVPKREWDQNIRGRIIQKFLQLKIPIAPGLPKRKEYLLSGGFTTQNYGASSMPGNQAVQIEFSDTVRMYDKVLRNRVLDALAEVLSQEFDRILEKKLI